MNKVRFAKSVAAGIIGLTMLTSCSGAIEKMGMNKCSSKKKESNSCSGKNSCSAKKSSNSCSSNSCSSKK